MPPSPPWHRRSRAARRAALLAWAALLAPPLGCAAGPESAVVAPPPAFPRFPAQASAAGVWAEARFPADHVELLGLDLLEHGLLPVELKLGTSADRGGEPHLARAIFDAHLYLQDGSVLEWEPEPRPAGASRQAARRLEEHALAFSLLEPWSDARSGLVCFRFDDERVRVQGTRVLSRRPGADRELDLLASVLSFTVATAEGPVELRVGLEAARESAR